MSDKAPVICIDGPSGTGKGTVARLLAKELNWHLLDSGALYRLVAIGAEQAGISYDDVDALSEFSRSMDVAFARLGPDTIELNGKELSALVRQEGSGEKASLVAVIPEVRAALLERQIEFRQPPGLVADGRDMGTIVFPDAQLKVFLTASAEERAQRRYKQLINKGLSVNLRDLLQDIQNRDERDSMRSASPLIPADDSKLLDTTDLNVDQVMEKLRFWVKSSGI